ncbi:MAG TPA: metallophosphoesterase [Verrucomicrobiae bacterium]|jgi:3',5'-cyclic AMP phosphodiesterase CpdA|nr:metallophosphoesterase [Verrucomicrobiae bacterium]
MKRANFLAHVGWTGAGVAYAMSAEGLFVGRALGATSDGTAPLFVQVSDSHIGFHQAANPDVTATFGAAIDAINALPLPPSFVVHTGDVTHLSKSEQFDTAKQILGKLRARTIVLPGEHDTIGARPRAFYDHFAAPAGSSGWYSWDEAGAHFVALVNVFDFEKMGLLGSEQLAWLERDLRAVKKNVPVVVFAHVPLYALYPQWGWTTQDGSKALALLAPFERVTVLNGHIHQVITHVEGNIHFATAAATAYPQPAPGSAAKPGPLTLPHGNLLHSIGFRRVTLTNGGADLDDRTLG